MDDLVGLDGEEDLKEKQFFESGKIYLHYENSTNLLQFLATVEK